MVVGAGAARVEVVAVLTLVALLGLERFEGPGTAEAKCFLPLLSFNSVACVDSAIAIAFVDAAMVGAVIWGLLSICVDRLQYRTYSVIIVGWCCVLLVL